ncbi:uncharacterized protein [Pocillopora verrucosa]|uniref:uncharacterized protein isoform X2 n=1 Tax=Pocillopora verrucosa TaxID=203993 RepID=UPI003342CD85
MEFFKCLTQLDGCRLTTDWLGPCRDFFMLQSGKGVCFKIWRKNYYQKEFRTDFTLKIKSLTKDKTGMEDVKTVQKSSLRW